MRGAVLLLLCASSSARADRWLDLAPIPELAAVEPAFQLDRYTVHEDWCGYRRWGTRHALGLGVGKRDDARDAIGQAAYAAGTGGHDNVLAFSTELSTLGRSARGRHEGRFELRNLDGNGFPRFALAVAGVAEHGPARGLAPVWLAHGRPTTADARGELSVVLGHDDDLAWLAGVDGVAGGTWWGDGPIDRASRQGVGLHVGFAPIHDDIPRGRIDLRARMERVTIAPTVAARGSLLGDATVRIVEVGTGFRDLTYHVDGDLLAVFTADAGVVRLAADTPGTTTRGAMVRAQIGAAVKTVRGRTYDFTTRRLGVGFAREPAYTADGGTLVSDLRLTATAGVETSAFTATASGGVSSLAPVAGDAPAGAGVLRYGGSVEAFVAVGGSLELGGHAAATLEPRALDPWAAPRTWAREVGVLLRWRGGSP